MAFSAALGCGHYQRRAKLVAPCCKKDYVCRLCHDEAENHVLDRKAVKFLICLLCNTKQDIGIRCISCRTDFGEYSCLECRLFDSQKGQYHCVECGICRIGPKGAFYHCKKCNLCLNNMLLRNHTCIENVSRDNCSVCVEDMHNSIETLSLLDCGHFLHEKCFKVINAKETAVCPLCRKNLVLKNFNGLQPTRPEPREPEKLSELLASSKLKF